MESPGTKLLYSVPWRMVAAVRVHVGCLQYYAGQVRVLRAPLHAPLHAPLRASASHRTRPQRVFSCALSPVAAAPPRMRYLAPRLARPPAATSRYCTLLYPRLARRSPLSTRACQRPVRSRSSSSRRWLLFHQSRVFFPLSGCSSFVFPFFFAEIVCFAASNPLIPIHNSDSSLIPLV